MADELTKSLLLEDVVAPRAVADALFVSVTSGVPIVQALTDAGALTPEMLSRYLARSEAPYLRQVAPLAELVDRLPPGLCQRLFAIPVRRDAITGTVDVVVADTSDLHPAKEIAFHLQAPVRVVRASVSALEEALRRLRRPSAAPASLGPPGAPLSRPPSARRGPPSVRVPPNPAPAFADPSPSPRDTLPPGPSSVTNPDGIFLDEGALRPSRVPAATPMRVSSPPPSMEPASRAAQWTRRGRDTPPWGTPIHNAAPEEQHESAPPPSRAGSEIPIPLTRRTFSAERGGTQRPPPLVDPTTSGLGEGIPVGPGGLRAVVELRPDDYEPAKPVPQQSFIPGIPGVPGIPGAQAEPAGPYAAYAPQLPYADIGAIVAAIRAAGSRDEVLELVLTGARMVAFKVALFVVKRDGFLGWACTPEFGDRAALQSVLVPSGAPSVFEEAIHEGLYLGPIRHDEAHGGLLMVMRNATRDVAVVPIRVSGKAAVLIVADELGDTMLATRRLEELARAAGEAFARIVRMRR